MNDVIHMFFLQVNEHFPVQSFFMCTLNNECRENTRHQYIYVHTDVFARLARYVEHQICNPGDSVRSSGEA